MWVWGASSVYLVEEVSPRFCASPNAYADQALGLGHVLVVLTFLCDPVHLAQALPPFRVEMGLCIFLMITMSRALGGQPIKGDPS